MTTPRALELALQRGWLTPPQVAACLAASARRAVPPLLLAQEWAWLNPAQLRELAELRPQAETTVTTDSSAGRLREPRPGELVAGARILQKLGSGGMGTVFLAQDASGLVAVKVLSSIDETLRKRFALEARAAEQLGQHPHIVALRRTHDDPRLPAIVFDFIEGPSLARVLEERALSRDELRRLLREMSEALHEIHRQGFIHRDLKPANILIRRDDGAALLTDFGAVRGDLEGLTRSQELIGTPAFMAPEQFDKSLGACGPQTDLWSLSVLAYLLLTGRPPFQGESLQQLATAILCRPAPPPSRFVEGLPPKLDEIIAWGLKIEPQERASDARLWFGAFEAALFGLESKNSAIPRSRRARPWGKIIALALLLLVLAAGLYFRSRPSLPPDSIQFLSDWHEVRLPRALAHQVLRESSEPSLQKLQSPISKEDWSELQGQLSKMNDSALDAPQQGWLKILQCLRFEERGIEFPETLEGALGYQRAARAIRLFGRDAQALERELSALNRMKGWPQGFVLIARLRQAAEEKDWSEVCRVAAKLESSDSWAESWLSDVLALASREAALQETATEDIEAHWATLLKTLPSWTAEQQREFWERWCKSIEGRLGGLFEKRGQSLRRVLQILIAARHAGAPVAPRFGPALVLAFEALARVDVEAAVRLAIMTQALDPQARLPIRELVKNQMALDVMPLELDRFDQLQFAIYHRVNDTVDPTILMDSLEIAAGAAREGIYCKIRGVIGAQVLLSGKLNDIYPANSRDPILRFMRGTIDLGQARELVERRFELTPGSRESDEDQRVQALRRFIPEFIADLRFAIDHQGLPPGLRPVAALALEGLLHHAQYLTEIGRSEAALGSAESLAEARKQALLVASHESSVVFDDALLRAYSIYGPSAEDWLGKPATAAFEYFKERVKRTEALRFTDPDGRRWQPVLRGPEDRARVLRELAQIEHRSNRPESATRFAQQAAEALREFPDRNFSEHRIVTEVCCRIFLELKNFAALEAWARGPEGEFIPEDIRRAMAEQKSQNEKSREAPSNNAPEDSKKD